jgi:hypothetical protein
MKGIQLDIIVWFVLACLELNHFYFVLKKNEFDDVLD